MDFRKIFRFGRRQAPPLAAYSPSRLVVEGGHLLPQGCCVMCCGCRQFLGINRENVDIGLPTGGIIPTGDLIRMLPDQERPECASFSDAASADDAALKAGWQIEDAEGSNHRCLACIEKERKARAPQRGALLRFENGRILPEEIK